MTYREYATMDRLMQGITPAPVEYIAEELGGEKFKTVCDDIYAVLKENELSVEQAEVMLEVVKARLKKMHKITQALERLVRMMAMLWAQEIMSAETMEEAKALYERCPRLLKEKVKAILIKSGFEEITQ